MSLLLKIKEWRINSEEEVQWIAAISLGLFYLGATFFIPGPDDLYHYYLPVAGGCTDCGFVPYYAQWFLWPLSILPHNLLWPIWTLVTISILFLIHYLRETNPLPILMTFPMMAQFWLGQIDALIALGILMVMGHLGNRPLIKGIGILLALIKPQISLPVLIIIIWFWNWDQRLKTGAVVIIGFTLSLFQFGLTWPLEWLASAQSLGVHLWRQPSTLLYPFALITLLTPLVLRGSSNKIQAALVSSAFIPQHSIYSHVVFLAFMKPSSWWVVPISLSWLVFIPLLDTNATNLSMLLPTAVLLKMLWDHRKTIQKKESENTEPEPGQTARSSISADK